MSDKDVFRLPSKGVWSDMREIKDREIRHLKITAGADKKVIDAPITINLRFIPRIFTAPLQALGLVTSIFTRMTNTRIIVHTNDEDD